MKEGKRPNWNKIIQIILILIIIGCVGSIIYDKMTRENEVQVIEDLKKNQFEAEEKENEPEKEPVKEEPYKSPIDFDYWHKINKDVIGYVKIKGTKIDYPILWDAKDNEKYLHTSIDGKESVHGSIYLDTLAKPDFTSQNSLIYGHHMKDGTMFKDVIKFENPEYLKKHKKVTIYLPDRKLNLIAVGAYYDKPEGYARRADFKSEEKFQEFVKDRLDRNKYKMKLPKHISQLVCLVTCSYSIPDGRTFLYCVPASDFKKDKKEDKKLNNENLSDDLSKEDSGSNNTNSSYTNDDKESGNSGN